MSAPAQQPEPTPLEKQVAAMAETTQAVLNSLQSLENQYLGAGSAMKPLPYTPFRHYS